MVEQGLGCQPRNARALWPEGHQRHGHARIACRLPVGLGIADQHRPRDHAPCALHRRQIGRDIGLARGQGIGPHQRAEEVTDAQTAGQVLGQAFRLVGADRHRKARAAQRLHCCDRAGVEAGMHINSRRIGLQKSGILRIHLGLITRANPRKAQPQHRPPAVKGRQRIARPQKITMAQSAETGIRGGQKIAACIRQRPVQIEDHSFHARNLA